MTDKDQLGTRAWPELRDVSGALLVPVGSVEQHGPHLPLATDTTIATAVAAALPGLHAPAVAFGASGEHEGFAGTMSIGTAALSSVLVELGRSACRWAPRICFVNGHGGNSVAVADAVRLLRFEGRDAGWLPCAVPRADAHAGRTETSLMLHLDPESVRTDLAEAGNTESIAALLPRLRAGGMAAVSANGVLGDPTGASAAEGERLFEQMVVLAADCFARWAPDGFGRLQ
ncbi:mycofactocin biosynthesis peptidyl-dipeptidase MftE [Aldersonia sp. NBC_00410]|uniref:mycofactocin biosynthesis peptidyl-dipeptidase MftE n=1 Tax=Aldersonia sp. NBC_00410 TaxID=2975954 RepID=UPI002250A079|nr:mycofactocin biosynthesis peptidyl-dipeptidase MftE [Aldersonia sp. NBC_00410]MCX5041594.1 mycofactocin biosynthesis peptidyl-dipeptidase MftE [Aldersonia sp. NBC_00410]